MDRQTQTLIGSSRYFGLDKERSEIEIGWTFLARSHWGGKYNREMKRLMLNHAFQFVDVVIFLVGEKNLRSRGALEKIGAVATTRREQRNVVDHVVYELTEKCFRPGIL